MTACTAASGMPYGSLTARISSPSDTMTPAKPSSPRSRPVSAAADSEAGRSPVSSGTRRWLGMIARTPARIAASNGGRSRTCRSRSEPSTVAMTSCESSRVLPWPGKCLAHAATPADCRPVTAAAACRATSAVSEPKARVPMIGLSAAVLTSTDGARLTLIPSWRRSAPRAA